MTSIFNNDSLYEDQSIWRKTLNTVLTPISTIIDVLDTPGGFVRDLLSGKSLNEAGSNIFNPSQRASGRDVISNFTGEVTPIEDRLTLGGFDIPSLAVAIGTDPLTYVTAGLTSLTKAGSASSRLSKALEREALLTSKLATLEAAPNSLAFRTTKTLLEDEGRRIANLKTQGVRELAATIDEQIAQGQRGLSLSIPGTQGEIVPTTLNKAFAPLAKTLDYVKKTLAETKAAELFRGGPKTNEIQILKAVDDDIQKSILHDKMDFEDHLNSIIPEGADKEALFTDIELYGRYEAMQKYHIEKRKTAALKFEKNLDKKTVVHELAQKELKLKYGIQDDLSGLPEAYINESLNLKKNFEESKMKSIRAFEAYVAKLNKKVAEKTANMQTKFEWINKQGDFPASLKQTFIDANNDYIGIEQSMQSAITHLEDPFVNYMHRDLTPEAFAIINADEAMKQRYKQYIADSTGSFQKRGYKGELAVDLNAQFKAEHGVDLFKLDPALSLAERKRQMEIAVNNASQGVTAINLLARPKAAADDVPIAQVFTELKLNGWKHPTTGQDLKWDLYNKEGKLRNVKSIQKSIKKAGEELKINTDLYLPRQTFEDLMRVQQFNLGDAENFLKFLDPINAVFRSWLTAGPQHIGTNTIGALWANMFAGVVNPVTYFNAGKELANYVRETNPKHWLNKWFKGAVETSDKFYAREWVEMAGIDRGFLKEIDPTGALSKGRPLLSKGEQIIDTLGNNRFTEFFRSKNKFIDEVARLTHYITKRKEGYSILEATQSVKKYLFDYREMSPFERKFLQRTVLFYTFARKNLPFAIQELFLNRAARFSAHATTDSLANQEITPAYVAEVGSLGLAPGTFIDLKNILFEPNKFSPQGGGSERVLDRIMQQLSPAIKTPLEILTGREFFRGKPQNEVNRVTGLLASDYNPFATKIETKSGVEYRIDPKLKPILDASPFNRITQTLADFNNPEISFPPSLIGLRTRKFDVEKLKVQKQKEDLIRILDSTPEVRGYRDYFSIEKDKDTKSKQLLKRLEQVNKDYKALLK